MNTNMYMETLVYIKHLETKYQYANVNTGVHLTPIWAFKQAVWQHKSQAMV